MQNEIQQIMPLLDGDGVLFEAGWARKPFWQYQRSMIKAPWYRIKEWDYYYVLSDDLEKGITFTISDLGYASMLAICWLDFSTKTYHQQDLLIPLSNGKLGLDEDSESSCVIKTSKNFTINYRVEHGRRCIKFNAPNLMLNEHKGISGEFELYHSEASDSLNIASNWADKATAFYYNRKINGMQAQGNVEINGQRFEFNSKNCLAGMDWGRGNWTYQNRWYWASANGHVNGEVFGLNLGYGFSDRSKASENVAFYKGVAHKIDDLIFPFNELDYLQSWQSTSKDGKLSIRFTPLLDRESHVNMLVIRSDQHQVFGYFDGEMTLDDGEVIKFERILGFAEDVYNRF